MEIKKFAECERRGINRLMNFRLPHYFYKIGMALIAASILMFFVRAFVIEGETETLRMIFKKVLLIGLLLMSIARDKEEDELITKLRMQSYTYAFIIGVLYALIMPYIDLGVSNLVHGGGEVYKDLGDFQVLMFMLFIQLFSFITLKRTR